ncbi:MAG TPA: nickel ABC transporter permease [Candidatus Acidoferrales bacterium]|nr:nickel ABC transporter permease [Candidatus Acidoferrales bacterium]
MKRYLARRLLVLAATALGAVTLVFFFTHLLPGDPVEVMLGETASAFDKEALRRELGLDQPVWRQYGRFLRQLAAADLGQSLYRKGAVLDLLLSRFPATLELTLGAIAVALFLAFPLGAGAAFKAGSLLDRAARLFSLLGLAMPNFWLGPLLIIAFSIELGWLPVSGRGGLRHLLLPALTLGMGMAAILTRMLRASLLEAMRQDYIRTARAKGAGEATIWLKHGLRNSLLSVITILGFQFGSLLTGSVITETIFSWPGVGRLTVEAIQTRDYPLIQGCVLFISLCYLCVNLAVDLLYSAVDPRIRYEK